MQSPQKAYADMSEESYPYRIAGAKRAIAERIAENESDFVRGFCDGVTWVPAPISMIYDHYKIVDEDHEPYSVHRMVRDARRYEKTRMEQAGTATGVLTGAAVFSTIPFVAVGSILASTSIDALDGVERTVHDYLNQEHATSEYADSE